MDDSGKPQDPQESLQQHRPPEPPSDGKEPKEPKEPGRRKGGGILMENAGYTAAAGVPREKLAAGVRYADSNHGGWDVSKRLADMGQRSPATRSANSPPRRA